MRVARGVGVFELALGITADRLFTGDRLMAPGEGATNVESEPAPGGGAINVEPPGASPTNVEPTVPPGGGAGVELDAPPGVSDVDPYGSGFVSEGVRDGELVACA